MVHKTIQEILNLQLKKHGEDKIFTVTQDAEKLLPP